MLSGKIMSEFVHSFSLHIGDKIALAEGKPVLLANTTFSVAIFRYFKHHLDIYNFKLKLSNDNVSRLGNKMSVKLICSNSKVSHHHLIVVNL